MNGYTTNVPGNGDPVNYPSAALVRHEPCTNRKERRAAKSKKGRSKHWPWRVR